MNKNTKNIKEEFVSDLSSRKIFNEAIEQALIFKLREKVINYKDQDSLYNLIVEDLPEEGTDITKLTEEFKLKIMDNSINFSSKNFIAFPDSGNSIAALTAHIYEGFLNQNMINSVHTSPAATFVEMTVINWFRKLIGYSVSNTQKSILDVGGMCVTGGVSANTIAILLARENKIAECITKGVYSNSKYILFVPEGINHYSAKAAMGWLGLGKNNVIEVKTNEFFKIDKVDLTNKLNNLKKTEIPLALIAYAGDSRTMSIDDFGELSKIAKKYNFWLHVDACHGLSLKFSNKYSNLIKEIDKADSVTIDPHKVLFTPYPCSYLLLKEPEILKKVSGISDLITKENFSFGQITPFFGSRPFDSLKIWFLIKHLGKNRIGELIDKRLTLAANLGRAINQDDDLILLNDVQMNSVVFIYVGNYKTRHNNESLNWLNKLNLEIQKKLFKEGEIYLHTFLLKDYKNKLGFGTNKDVQVLRIIIGNPLTSIDSLKSVLLKIKTAGEDLEKIGLN